MENIVFEKNRFHIKYKYIEGQSLYKLLGKDLPMVGSASQPKKIEIHEKVRF